MLIDNALARPFSRWDVPLGEGEPSHGYFARLVANEGHQSVRVYANEIGLSGRNIVPEEMLQAIERLPLPQASLENLRMWTPIVDGPYCQIGAERLRIKQVSWTKRRWCPACLTEGRHHRIWWDVICFEVCPHHRLRLVSETEKGGKVRTFWPHFDIGPDGGKLTGEELERFDPVDPTLETFIETRLAGRRTDDLRDHELFDIIEVSGLVGKFIAGEDNARRNGFQAILLPEEEFQGRLRERIVETVPAAVRHRGLYASLSHVLPTATMDSRASLAHWFEKQLMTAFAEVGRIGRKRFRDIEIKRGEYTLVEASREIGMRSAALSRFAKSLGIGHTPRMDAHSFTKEDIEALRGALSELVTLPESISITGIPAHEFRLLQQAGLIKAHHVGTYFGDKGARFMRSEVITLVERTWAAAGSDDGDALNLYRFSRRSGYRVGEVLAMVVKGELMPCRLDPKATGFRRLMFR